MSKVLEFLKNAGGYLLTGAKVAVESTSLIPNLFSEAVGEIFEDTLEFAKDKYTEHKLYKSAEEKLSALSASHGEGLLDALYADILTLKGKKPSARPKVGKAYVELMLESMDALTPEAISRFPSCQALSDADRKSITEALISFRSWLTEVCLEAMDRKDQIFVQVLAERMKNEFHGELEAFKSELRLTFYGNTFEKLDECPSCFAPASGDENDLTAGVYRCKRCGRHFSLGEKTDLANAFHFAFKKELEGYSKVIISGVGGIISERDEKKIKNATLNLRREVQPLHPDPKQVMSSVNALLSLDPENALATFFRLMYSADEDSYCEFLIKGDISSLNGSDRMLIAEKALDFIKSKNDISAVSAYLKRAIAEGEASRLLFERLYSEATKLDSEQYDPAIPRDLFIIYKHEDLATVRKLVKEIEEEDDYECFYSERNLQNIFREGDKTYWEKIFEAMEACRAILFVSTEYSRCNEGYHLKEMREWMKREHRRISELYPEQGAKEYGLIPKEYKKPRYEYFIGIQDCGGKTKRTIGHFFDGYNHGGTCNLETVCKFIDTVRENREAPTLAAKTVAAQPSLDSLLASARFLTVIGKTEEAREKYNSLLELYPTEPRCYIGLIHLLSGKYTLLDSEEIRAVFDIAREMEIDLSAAGDTGFNAYYERREKQLASLSESKEPKAMPEVKPSAIEAAKAMPEVKPSAVEAVKVMPEVKPSAVEAAKAMPEAKPSAVEAAKAMPEVKPGAVEAAKAMPEVKPSAIEVAKAMPEVKPSLGKDKRSGGGVAVAVKAKATEIKAAENAEAPVMGAGKKAPRRPSVPADAAARQRAAEKGFVIYEDGTLTEYAGEGGRIVIPDFVKVIGDDAFENRRDITSVEIPEGVDTFGCRAFYGCTALEQINIPEGVASIGIGAFSACGIVGDCLSVSPSNEYYYVKSGCLIERESKTLVSGFADCILPSDGSVVKIGDYAFEECGIAELVIPESITEIGACAFYESEALSSVRLHSKITEIGNGAFSGCNSLKSITIDGESPCYLAASDCLIERESGVVIAGCNVSAIPEEGILGIGNLAFAELRGLREIQLPEGVDFIGAQAFAYCSVLSSVTLPATLTKIEDGAFFECQALKEIKIYKGCRVEKGALPEKCKVTYLDSPFEIDGEGTLLKYSGISERVIIPRSVKKIGSEAFKDNAFVKTVVIPEGVSAIGNRAFEDCLELKEITLPSTLTEIGEYAFSYCATLNGVTIPLGVTELCESVFSYCEQLSEITLHDEITGIGGYAFSSCKALRSFIIPSKTRELGEGAFYNCTALKGLFIPEGVTSIGESPLAHCNGLISLEVAEGNPKYYSRAKCLLDREGVLVSGTKYSIIPDDGSVRTIGAYAFNGIEIEEITVPEGVREIKEGAFWDCTHLKNVHLPASVSLIGEEPFTNVGALESITVDGGNENYCVTSGCLINRRTGALLRGFGKSEIPADGTVLSIEAYAFSAQALEAVKIPSGVTSIGEGAFEKCKLLKHVKIPSTVTSIGDFAFHGCEEMTEIRIPESVRKIDSSTFFGCNRLKAIHLSYRCEIEEKAIPKGCKIYRLETDFKTDNNDILTACACKDDVIIIPNGIKGIGYSPFGSLTAKKIILPKSITNLSYTAFSGIKTLTSITVDEDNPKYKSIDGILYSKDGKELIRFPRGKAVERLILPEGLTKIGNDAFDYCSGLVSVHIPAGVTALNGYNDEAFKYCTSLTEITVAEENKKFRSTDGNLYSKDGKTLIRYTPAKSAKSFTIPKGVTRIYKYAFEGCFKLKEIIIPQGVIIIERGAFYNCSALTSVNIPSGVAEIDSYAFFGCSSLDNVVIPDSVPRIGDKAFENCKKLSGIKVPGGVTVIGEEAFKGCTSLADLTVSEGVTEIRKRAFQNCRSLISVTLPDSVSTIGDYAFFDCDRLESLSVGKNCNVKTLVLPAGCKLKRRGLFDKIFKRKQS